MQQFQKLPKGTKVPTSLPKVDDFFGGGLALGDFFGVLSRGDERFMSAETALFFAAMMARYASVTCFVDSSDVDPARFLEKFDPGAKRPIPAPDKDKAFFSCDGLRGLGSQFAGGKAPYGIPLTIEPIEGLTLTRLEEALEASEVVVLSSVWGIEGARGTSSVDSEPYLTELAPGDKTLDRARTLCKTTGSLLVALASCSYTMGGSSSDFTYPIPGNADAVPFDGALLLDYLPAREDIANCEPVSGLVAKTVCTDRRECRMGEPFELYYALGNGLQPVYDSDQLIDEMMAKGMAVFTALPFPADDGTSQQAAGAQHPARGCAGEARPVAGCRTSGWAIKDSGIQGWFYREMEERLVSPGARPFWSYVYTKRPDIGAVRFFWELQRFVPRVMVSRELCGMPPEDVLTFLKHDYPELFYVSRLGAMEPVGKRAQLVFPEYRMSPDDAAATLLRMERAAHPLLKEVADKPIADKVEFLHDWLCANVACVGSELDFLSEADAVLLQGRGTDEAITRAWHFLCIRAGVMAGATIGKKNDHLSVWSIVALPAGTEDYSDAEHLEHLHFDIAADVRMSASAGEPVRVLYGLTREEMAKAGYQTPFDFVNQYAGDLVSARAKAKAESSGS